jgi:hypothetical protein
MLMADMPDQASFITSYITYTALHGFGATLRRMSNRSLTLRLDDDLWRELEAFSAETGRSRAELVRDALRRQMQLMRLDRLKQWPLFTQLNPLNAVLGQQSSEEVLCCRQRGGLHKHPRMGHQPNKPAVTIGPGDRNSMARGSRPAQTIRGIQELAIAATITHRNGETILAVMHRQWQRTSGLWSRPQIRSTSLCCSRICTAMAQSPSS